MSEKSWQIDRRRMLVGSGTALALPLLDGMLHGAQKEDAESPRRRMCSLYFPYGVQMSGEYAWFPTGKGKEFTFSKTLESLQQHRDDVTVFGGLSHPNGRKMNGHTTADNFLTGAYIKPDGSGQTESLDTFVSQFVGKSTRYKSLVLSTDEGIGEVGRRNTVSTTSKGRTIPPLVSTLKLYHHLFDKIPAAARETLKRKKSLLDALLEDSKSLNGNLGKRDKQKLDEYMSSVRNAEKKALRAEAWLNTPKPTVDPDSLLLNANPIESPKDYLQTMFDLMFLALQTDSTRVITYSIGNMRAGGSMASMFPAIVTGDGKSNHHKFAHGNKTGKYDAFLAEQLSYFIGRLKSAKEGEHSMLDNTMILYGSSNSKTHSNRNYPLVLAGGSGLGIKHGQYLKYPESVPLSNLHLTMLHGLGIESDSFSDSSGTLPELF
jgi:hypothetical protein